MERIEDSYLKFSEVRKIVPFSASTIKRLAADGRFPRPFYLSPRVAVFKRSEISAWLTFKASCSERHPPS